MRCPYCGHLDTKVIDSRPVEHGIAIRRRRDCAVCGRRFSTYERLDVATLVVVKRDGRREPFDREKLRQGILRACHRRAVPADAVDRLVSEIEQYARSRGEHEMSSLGIGERVMEGLRGLDEVAYVRFASVYRRFGDVDTLIEEAEHLRERNRTDEALRAQVPLLPIVPDRRGSGNSGPRH